MSPDYSIIIRQQNRKAKFKQIKGGVETGFMYMQYVQGIQPIVPARTTFIDIYNHSSGLFIGLFGACTYHGMFSLFIAIEVRAHTYHRVIYRLTLKNVPTYLLALHDFRPSFNSPI